MRSMRQPHSTLPAESAAERQDLLGHLLREAPSVEGKPAVEVLSLARPEEPGGDRARSPGRRHPTDRPPGTPRRLATATGRGWQLVAVVRATHTGRATHVCPVSSWAQRKATSATRLSGGKIAVLPPKLAQDRGLVTPDLGQVSFEDLEALRKALDHLARRRSSSGCAGQESGG